MEKHNQYLTLLFLIAFLGITFMLFSNRSETISGRFTSFIVIEGSIDDNRGRPINYGTLLAESGGEVVGEGSISGTYLLHIQSSMSKNKKWYKEHLVDVYVDGKYCKSIDIYPLLIDTNYAAQAQVDLECDFEYESTDSPSTKRYRWIS